MRAIRLAGLVMASCAVTAAAQQRPCQRIGTTSFVFGRTGGNIREVRITLAASGRLTVASDTMAVAARVLHVPRDSVRALARRAWRREFVSLPTAPTRPTANPDAARDFIEIHSACGSRHVELLPAEAPAPFRELRDRLARLARLAESGAR